MHPAHDLVHVRQLLGGGAYDHVGTLCDDVQLVVGHDRGDLDDDVAGRLEPGHLEIDPGEHRGAS